MKTLLDNFERWMNDDNGPAIVRQMQALEQAANDENHPFTKFELTQVKAAVRIIWWTIQNERILNK